MCFLQETIRYPNTRGKPILQFLSTSVACTLLHASGVANDSFCKPALFALHCYSHLHSKMVNVDKENGEVL